MALTLRQRLVLINIAVLLIALAILAGIVVQQLSQGLYRQLDFQLEQVAEHAREQIAVLNGSPVLLPDAEEYRGQLGRDGWLRVLDAQGNITDGLGNYASVPLSAQTLPTEQYETSESIAKNDGHRVRVLTMPLLAEETVLGYVQVGTDQYEIQETVTRMVASLAVGVPLTLLVAAFISFFAARQALRPLTAMAAEVSAVTAETLSHRMTIPKAKDEIHTLATAFNSTLDRLAAAFQRQRRFTADASHELRTPVTAILGHADVSLSKPRSAEAYRHTLTLIRGEAERMQRLIGRMLALARLETNRYPLSPAPTDIVPLAASLLDTLRPRAEEKGLALKMDAPSAAVLNTDADALTQILLNLLENAISYTETGNVALKIDRTPTEVAITISDTGVGISEEHLAHIFEAFYRADESRHQRENHIGLGLALTRELVQLLGGQIEFDSRVGKGTTVRVRFPIEA